MKDTITISTRISKNVAHEIEEVIKKGRYLSTSDFLRAALRTELEKIMEIN